jgi:hypothetical protein
MIMLEPMRGAAPSRRMPAGGNKVCAIGPVMFWRALFGWSRVARQLVGVVCSREIPVMMGFTAPIGLVGS